MMYVMMFDIFIPAMIAKYTLPSTDIRRNNGLCKRCSSPYILNTVAIQTAMSTIKTKSQGRKKNLSLKVFDTLGIVQIDCVSNTGRSANIVIAAAA